MRRVLQEYDWVALRPEDFRGKTDFARLFGRAAPLHVEIGSGKGAFLVSQAQAQPQVDFLGVEWARKYYRYCVDRIGRWGLKNVRVIRTDAATFLAESIADESVDCFHVYFPDPWPKKRHHKRRFFCAANAEHLLRSLKPGGQIRLATDFAEYFEQILAVVAEFGGRLQPIEFERPAGAQADELVGTNYERKYLKEERPIRTLAVKKTE